MTKKDVECQVHTWMIKKGKKAMVYKARKDRRKEKTRTRKKRKKQISRACPKRLIATFHARIFTLLH